MSGILIPLAEVSGGRAAQIRVEADRSAGVAAEFGDRIAQVGDAMETDRLDREVGRARVEMTRALNAKRLEFESVNDPDAIDRGWAETAASLREQFVGAADRRNADRLGMAFDEQADRHALALGGRALDLRQGEYRINVENLGQAILEGSAGFDAGSRASAIDAYADSLAAAVQAGAMSPEDANTKIIAQRDALTRTAALRALDRDPAGLIAELDGGAEYEGMDPIWAEGLRARATSALATEAARAEAEADRQAKARFNAIGVELDQIAQIGGVGRTPAQLEILLDPEVQAHPKFAEALAATELLAEMPRLAIATVAEIDALIASESAKPIGRKYEAERLAVLRRQRDAAAAGWGKDPIGYARTSGFSVPDLPEFDPSDPKPFRDGLAARGAYARALTAQGYGDIPLPFDAEETEALRKAAGVDADPETRAALALELGAILGPKVASGVADDPVFGHMAGMLAAGGAAPLAREVFRGQQAMDADNVVLPPVKDRIGVVFDNVAIAIAQLPGGEAMQGEVVAAADALYAARMRRVDPTAELDGARYAQALHEVLGGTGASGSPGAYGGVQLVNGALAVLPPGTNALQVESALYWVGGLERAEVYQPMVPSQIGAEPEVRQVRVVDPEQIAKSLAAISVGGNQTPDLDGVPIDAGTLSQMHLRRVGPSVYALVWKDQVLTNPDGSDYTLSLPALLRGAGQ